MPSIQIATLRGAVREVSDLVRLPDPRENVRASLREVVRDVGDQPHVFWRLTLSGWRFTHRSEEPFMLVGKTLSRFVLIAEDETSAAGYFDRALPRANQVSFGWGRTIVWDFDLAVEPARASTAPAAQRRGPLCRPRVTRVGRDLGARQRGSSR